MPACPWTPPLATPDLSHPDYWNDLYRASDTGWDKGRPAPPLVRLLGESLLPARAFPNRAGHELEFVFRRL